MSSNVMMGVVYHYDGDAIKSRIVIPVKMKKDVAISVTLIANVLMTNICARTRDVYQRIGSVMEHPTVSMARMKMTVMSNVK